MHARSQRIRRAVAAAIATFMLVAVAPPAAFAEDGTLWSRWAKNVTNRGTKAEIPLAILVSIPVLIATTPFYLLEKGLAKIGSSGDDE